LLLYSVTMKTCEYVFFQSAYGHHLL